MINKFIFLSALSFIAFVGINNLSVAQAATEAEIAEQIAQVEIQIIRELYNEIVSISSYLQTAGQETYCKICDGVYAVYILQDDGGYSQSNYYLQAQYFSYSQPLYYMQSSYIGQPCYPGELTKPLGCIPYTQATYNIYTQAAYVPYVQSNYYTQVAYVPPPPYTQATYYLQAAYSGECPPGYVGNPAIGCIPWPPYTQSIYNLPQCPPGYIGNPIIGCIPFYTQAQYLYAQNNYYAQAQYYAQAAY